MGQGTTDLIRAGHARPREAPGLSAGGLQVICRQVTLKPPSPRSHQNAKGPRLLTGASIIVAVRAVTRRPSGRPARCAPRRNPRPSAPLTQRGKSRGCLPSSPQAILRHRPRSDRIQAPLRSARKACSCQFPRPAPRTRRPCGH